jgi:hypothetical protein
MKYKIIYLKEFKVPGRIQTHIGEEHVFRSFTGEGIPYMSLRYYFKRVESPIFNNLVGDSYVT